MDWIKKEESSCVGVSSVSRIINAYSQKYETQVVIGKIWESVPEAESENYACEVWTNIKSHRTIINVYSLDYC